jgi:DNA-binding response OmpR family regulator
MNSTAILVIEDEQNIAGVVRIALERHGFQVTVSPAGEEGLAEFERRPFALVILDIGLPGIDGYEVCRRIRKTSGVPVIMLTARDEEIDEVVGLELGADDYVAKPFSPRELVARVKAVLRRAQPRGPVSESL